MEKDRIIRLRNSFEEELNKLTDYWTGVGEDKENGGFVGTCIGNDHGKTVPESDKKIVGHGRTFWGMAASARITGREDALKTAERAFEFLKNHFLDKDFGGAYSAVSKTGEAVNTNKQPYGTSFLMYGLVEYYRITHDSEALNTAIEIYKSFEEHAHDDEFGGYFAEFTRDWKLLTDKNGNANMGKTLTAQQHLLECYTELYSQWQDEHLKNRIKELAELCCGDKMLKKPNFYYYQQLDRQFNGLNDVDSRNLYGDTAEMAWLIPESVKVIGDEAYDKMAAECSEGLLNQIMTVALDNENGGIFESETDGTVSTDKVWWVECEAVNAFLYAFQKTGDDKYFELAENTWNFCKNHLIKPDGIWYWSTDKFGNINPRPEKPSPIPDTYHTCRTCVRGIEVLNSLVKI